MPCFAEAAGREPEGRGDRQCCDPGRAHAAGIILSDPIQPSMPRPTPHASAPRWRCCRPGSPSSRATGPDGPAGSDRQRGLLALDRADADARLPRPRLAHPARRPGGRTTSGSASCTPARRTIARAFATKAPVAEKWDGVDWSERDGIPAIDGALVWVACDLRDVIAGGDHVIVTGEVLALRDRRRRPAGLPRRRVPAARLARKPSGQTPQGVQLPLDARMDLRPEGAGDPREPAAALGAGRPDRRAELRLRRRRGRPSGSSGSTSTASTRSPASSSSCPATTSPDAGDVGRLLLRSTSPSPSGPPASGRSSTTSPPTSSPSPTTTPTPYFHLATGVVFAADRRDPDRPDRARRLTPGLSAPLRTLSRLG